MTDGLNVVAVRAYNIRGVVVGMVVATKTWRTIIHATGRESGTIKLVDLLAALSRERQVKTRGRLFRYATDTQ
jgi:hypothetical protein